MSEPSKDPLNVTPDSTPCVPVFNCLVYVGRTETGVQARVANLDGFHCTAGDERAALGKLVKEFKQHLAECVAAGESPQWIDPPPEPSEGEQQRWIPVHL